MVWYLCYLKAYHYPFKQWDSTHRCGRVFYAYGSKLISHCSFWLTTLDQALTRKRKGNHCVKKERQSPDWMPCGWLREKVAVQKNSNTYINNSCILVSKVIWSKWFVPSDTPLQIFFPYLSMLYVNFNIYEILIPTLFFLFHVELKLFIKSSLDYFADVK